MKIVLATSNQDKVKEIKEFLKGYEIYALSEILTPFEIIENGTSFKQNALIKSRAVYEKIKAMGLGDEFIALSDDSGISVNVLNGRPGIYSARFSGENATDKSNRKKLIDELNALNLSKTKAFYTACIAISSKFGNYTTHGFMHGDVINDERGDNGFGYDFMFIPNGFDKTIGELENSVKLEISHRSKGLNLASFVLKFLQKRFNG
ncbi:non-canonical purine NTP pyrophosphatase [Campylobacter gastrosuis]|uniref:dITP/XTP pyrophosphatase n=1 Tax=Campylobacter gastrosuis TaxID=2974576 RepID=A0ABT7HPG4_9BACT|nr:non-canonical purine NTP pyrophosphatase [Campylobacter gastrosuis]MDL0088622.1 non-canonical purine NTP pyrophosphatase [Campylobacter gastrosuis]